MTKTAFMSTRSRDHDRQRAASSDERGTSASRPRDTAPPGSIRSIASTQDRTLDAWNEEKRLLTVYLRNGATQTGRVADWDLFSITLDVRGVVERIQKKAILSITPARGAPEYRPDRARKGRVKLEG